MFPMKPPLINDNRYEKNNKHSYSYRSLILPDILHRGKIGANVCIDKSQMGSTVIRRGVKIDNLCQIAHNVEIGCNTVMASQTGIAGSTKIGGHCIIAGQVGIAGHLNIADNTTIGAQSGILGSVKESGQTLMGSPAFPLKQYLRSYAVFKRAGK